ncbi:hypothetical protein PRECH8_13150 [Insulibacter thermoxylanivorax]|uniref:histidine kinase n=1 Tax=Insulibacter thermoxylanivorax TaxID=2749268 RepID=A0A916QFK9_9BACL|nr:diguanylate cyclase [Insulibacter thermoxylanivorax]GFR38019.1 hypothetical protein PRECH8_13150 [Insulibacter thermoxylanivorax]
MRRLGTMTSLAASITVAVFFVHHHGVSSLSVLVGVIVLLAGLMIGRRYDHYAYLAIRDDLTDCYNRRFIRDRMSKLMKHAQIYKKLLCIALIDLDDFKRINDHFGHRHGDHLLRVFSSALMSICPNGAYVARLGDDEFILAVPNIDSEGMKGLIQELHEKLKKRLTDVKYSVGIAEYPVNGHSYDELINHAERQMYGMKWSNAQEENNEKYVNYLLTNQQNLIDQWYEEMTGHDLSITKLMEGFYFHTLFDYLLALHTPPQEHPIMEGLADFCRIIIEQGIPSEEVRISTSVMRNLLIDHHERTLTPFPIHVVKEVIGRLDELETAINNEYAKMELIKKENDITELHEDRLSLIGKMAASMAHEIRNPLTSIKGFLKLIRANIPSDSNPNIEKYINIIESEFENIHMQITGLLSFSKKQIIEEPFSYLSANQLLHSMISLLSPRLINENVELKINEREVFYIYGQKVALQQVISNILNNGIDALSMNQDQEKIMRIDIYSDDEASYIAISNNGPEISEEVREVLFRPFTTTKEDGTGLGLAICKQIMIKNNGDITFESNPEETTFRLIFYKEAMTEPEGDAHLYSLREA